MSPDQSSRRSSWRSSISSLADLLKEHHHAVNGAYASLHGGPRHHHSRPGMPAPSYAPRGGRRAGNVPSRRRTTVTTREIVEPETEVGGERRPGLGRRLSGAWGEVKERAKERHRAVNEAYQAYYGLGMYRGDAAEIMWS
jgi:hypothetical protein